MWLQKIYVGEDYQESGQYAAVLLGGAVFYGLSLFFGCFYEAYKKTGRSVVPVVICAAADIGLCFLLIPRIGLWGAVIAYIVSYAVYFLIVMADVSTFVNLPVDKKRLLLNSVMLILLIAAVTFEVYPYAVAVIVIFLYIVINRNILSSLLSEARAYLKKVTAK